MYATHKFDILTPLVVALFSKDAQDDVQVLRTLADISLAVYSHFNP